jgi:predicted neuraminidase
MGAIRLAASGRAAALALATGILTATAVEAQTPAPPTQDVLPYQLEHVHGSSIAELPNGDLLVTWFQGSGERWADDVRIMGARKKQGSAVWSDAFVLADVEGFPDINPVVFVDGRDRLWLLWYTVLANQWETSLLRYRISDDYLTMDGAPRWNWQEVLHVKPGGLAERGIQPDDPFVRSVRAQLEAQRELIGPGVDPEAYARWRDRTLARAGGEDMIRAGRVFRPDGTYEERDLGYPLSRRIGWQTRSKPTITRTGRMIVPLYSDGFSFSLMAYTDDWGETWRFSTPLVGMGNIQASIAETRSGELVAYMRDNGPPPKRLHVSRSTDNGETWSLVRDSDLPNPGSAADVVTLSNGNWALIYNDTESGRHSLVVSLSEDEGATWPYTRTLELDSGARPSTAHYPSIIQGADGRLHATYSYFVPATATAPERKTVRYATFTEQWLREGTAGARR